MVEQKPETTGEPIQPPDIEEVLLEEANAYFKAATICRINLTLLGISGDRYKNPQNGVQIVPIGKVALSIGEGNSRMEIINWRRQVDLLHPAL
ncbi:hypothetical protein M1437_02680 [Patescibacteria group bacterium]|nr:hypothetical protein [Patescibacteria group bacterium]